MRLHARFLSPTAFRWPGTGRVAATALWMGIFVGLSAVSATAMAAGPTGNRVGGFEPASGSLQTRPDIDKVAPTSDDSDRDEWMIAVVSALGGALLTLGGERVWVWRQDRRTLRSLLAYLAIEVNSGKTEAERRSARTADTAFPFDPPLGKSAWEVISSSSVSWRLARKRQLFQHLLAYYDGVDDANHRAEVAQQIFSFTQTVQLDDDVARAYHAMAADLVTLPYSAVASAAATALQSLQAEIGRT